MVPSVEIAPTLKVTQSGQGLAVPLDHLSEPTVFEFCSGLASGVLLAESTHYLCGYAIVAIPCGKTTSSREFRDSLPKRLGQANIADLESMSNHHACSLNSLRYAFLLELIVERRLLKVYCRLDRVLYVHLVENDDRSSRTSARKSGWRDVVAEQSTDSATPPIQ